jgi:hypothetical protein
MNMFVLYVFLVLCCVGRVQSANQTLATINYKLDNMISWVIIVMIDENGLGKRSGAMKD